MAFDFMHVIMESRAFHYRSETWIWVCSKWWTTQL